MNLLCQKNVPFPSGGTYLRIHVQSVQRLALQCCYTDCRNDTRERADARHQVRSPRHQILNCLQLIWRALCRLGLLCFSFYSCQNTGLCRQTSTGLIINPSYDLVLEGSCFRGSCYPDDQKYHWSLQIRFSNGTWGTLDNHTAKLMGDKAHIFPSVSSH